MLTGALLGLSLVTTAAFEPTDLSPNGGPGTHMTAQQRVSAMRPVLRSATDCVVRAVTADPRFRQTPAAGDMNELIVASMAPCADAMRALIDAHDRLFGDGSGEAFFMGPYLDGLPLSVNKILNGVAAPADPQTKPQRTLIGE